MKTHSFTFSLVRSDYLLKVLPGKEKYPEPIWVGCMLRGASQDDSHQQSREERPGTCIFTPGRPDPTGSQVTPVSTAGANSQQALGLGTTFQGTQSLPLAHLHLSTVVSPPPGLLLPSVPPICGKAFQKFNSYGVFCISNHLN